MSRSHTPSLNKTHIANIGRHNNKVEDKHTKALKKLESFKTEYPEYYITSTGLAEQFIKDHKIPEGEGAQASLPNITLDFTFKSILTNLLFLTVFLNSIKVTESEENVHRKAIFDCAAELYKDPRYEEIFNYYERHKPNEPLIHETVCKNHPSCAGNNMMYLPDPNKIVYFTDIPPEATKHTCSSLKHEIFHLEMANSGKTATASERWKLALEGDAKINKECVSIFKAYYKVLSNLISAVTSGEGLEKFQTLIKHVKKHNPEMKQYTDLQVGNMLLNERERMDFYLKSFGEEKICGETIANIKYAPFSNSIGKLQELFAPEERVKSVTGKGKVDIATAVDEHANHYHNKIHSKFNQGARGEL